MFFLQRPTKEAFIDLWFRTKLTSVVDELSTKIWLNEKKSVRFLGPRVPFTLTALCSLLPLDEQRHLVAKTETRSLTSVTMLRLLGIVVVVVAVLQLSQGKKHSESLPNQLKISIQFMLILIGLPLAMTTTLLDQTLKLSPERICSILKYETGHLVGLHARNFHGIVRLIFLHTLVLLSVSISQLNFAPINPWDWSMTLSQSKASMAWLLICSAQSAKTQLRTSPNASLLAHILIRFSPVIFVIWPRTTLIFKVDFKLMFLQEIKSPTIRRKAFREAAEQRHLRLENQATRRPFGPWRLEVFCAEWAGEFGQSQVQNSVDQRKLTTNGFFGWWSGRFIIRLTPVRAVHCFGDGDKMGLTTRGKRQLFLYESASRIDSSHYSRPPCHIHGGAEVFKRTLFCCFCPNYKS